MRPLVFWSLILIVLGGLTGCETVKPQVYSQADGIPFELDHGLIWVKVVAKGKALDFMVDSGAGSTVVSGQAARRLRLKHGEPLPVYGVGAHGVAYRISGFDGNLGGIPLKSDVFAVELRRPKVEKRRRLDGLIGQDFFRDRIVRIDFAARRIHLLPKAPGHSGHAVLPLRYQHDAMCVPVGVNGLKPEWTRLDTGCVSALEWGAAVAAKQDQTEQGGEGEGRSRREVDVEVQLGSERIPGVTIGLHSKPLFHGEAGLLGNGLLSRYRVTIDARAMELLLER